METIFIDAEFIRELTEKAQPAGDKWEEVLCHLKDASTDGCCSLKLPDHLNEPIILRELRRRSFKVKQSSVFKKLFTGISYTVLW